MCMSAYVCARVRICVHECVPVCMSAYVCARVRTCVHECVPVCMSAYVCASFNEVAVASHIYCHSLFHIPFNNLYSIHNCLLCKNPGNESIWSLKIKSLIHKAVDTDIVMYAVYKMYKCV